MVGHEISMRLIAFREIPHGKGGTKAEHGEEEKKSCAWAVRWNVWTGFECNELEQVKRMHQLRVNELSGTDCMRYCKNVLRCMRHCHCVNVRGGQKSMHCAHCGSENNTEDASKSAYSLAIELNTVRNGTKCLWLWDIKARLEIESELTFVGIHC
jgi:hypothetical protein